jgi:hypothetical protein
MPKPPWHPSRGTSVQVRNRFDQAWVSGFEVAERRDEGAMPRYRLLRRSDHIVLPVVFDEGELRPEG